MSLSQARQHPDMMAYTMAIESVCTFKGDSNSFTCMQNNIRHKPGRVAG